MNVTKAVITAAGNNQRHLPLQTLIDRDGSEKSLIRIIIDEVQRAGIDDIGIVVQPGDEKPLAHVSGDAAGRLHFIVQAEPKGYGHAVYRAKDFIGKDPFLHLVGDHLWVSRTDKGCAEQLVQMAQAEACSVSAVQATREGLLPYFGCVGGKRVPRKRGLYQVEEVIEKPTPTEAEQRLIVPGLRAGHYLCFFGMHVLSPSVFNLLQKQIDSPNNQSAITLSDALSDLAKNEKYLALELPAWRYDIGVKYGLLTAQLSLALSGGDRDRVLSLLLETLALRETKSGENQDW